MANGTAGLAKATLRVVAGSPSRTELRFLYNPTEYTVTKGATWNRPQTTGAKSATKPQFGGTNPQTVQMEIFFDAFEEGVSVGDDVACLLEWTKPTPASVQQKKPEPPILSLDWGRNRALAEFRGYLKSVSAKYTLFDPSGDPLRVTANITLEEVPTDPKGQNPTSGAREGRRRRVLTEGDTLASIAWAEYGDATLWRALATFNGVDDPMRLRPGTSVLVPTITEATRLA
ncbi:MAG: LysM peptidoglycan-binding domain-containing protein [Chloroflexi bacterium]|nr:LysM peptidoglycan-binding domain-containing protein [Chloroflexota bacterium]